MAALNLPILKGLQSLWKAYFQGVFGAFQMNMNVIALINVNPVGRMDKGWGREFFLENLTV